MANPSVTAPGYPATQGAQSPPSLSAPDSGPLSKEQLNSATQLESQTSSDNIATTENQAHNEALNTANSIRQSTQSTLEGISNQAVSLSQQFIGDEISQAKKSIENSGKGV